MKNNVIFITGAFFILLSHTQSVFGEVSSDQTLGVEKTIVIDSQINGVASKEIQGGARRGESLFHSFHDFSIRQHQSLYFQNPVGVKNIIGRVTGKNRSSINGKLGVLGSANLYLVNPNGITFGSGSSLDINGSFIASTASTILFEDGIKFSAVDPTSPPLLNIKVPTGIQFGKNAGSIINQSQHMLPNGQVVGLNLPANKLLGLYGGPISLSQGHITVPDGQVDIGSLTNEEQVFWQSENSLFSTQYPQTSNFGDVKLSDISRIDTSGNQGGRINIRAANLTISSGTQLNSSTFGDLPGKGIDLNISETLQVIGTADQAGVFDPRSVASGILIPLQSAIVTNTFSPSPAGNIAIKAQKLIIKDGALIISESLNDGKSGNIDILVEDSIQLDGLASYPEDQSVPPEAIFPGFSPEFVIESRAASKIAVVALGSGNSGEINLQTERLSILNGGVISSTPFGNGQGGNINIHSPEKVIINGTSPKRLIGSQVVSTNFGRGTAGAINLATNNLQIADGANISSGAIGEGGGGDINIDVKNDLQLLGSAMVDGRPTGNTITADSIGSSKAGNIKVRANNVQISDSGGISINSNSSTSPGNLSISSNSILLDNANISAQSISGSGGNIGIQFRDLLLLKNNSNISSSAGTQNSPGDGGNITILGEGLLLALPNSNSDIVANSFNGRGGMINIAVNQILGLARRAELTPGNDIIAISINQPELDGTVTLNAVNNDTQSRAIQLPDNLVDPSDLTQTSCSKGNIGQHLKSSLVLSEDIIPSYPSDYYRYSSGFTQKIWSTSEKKTSTVNETGTELKKRKSAAKFQLQHSMSNKKCMR